jgi:hypothetical protein
VPLFAIIKQTHMQGAAAFGRLAPALQCKASVAVTTLAFLMIPLWGATLGFSSIAPATQTIDISSPESIAKV